ncbi:MAG TPA: ATP-dependent sacrificial sulfur transferase LarE [Pyrinomonadaceae bacterium]|nr:ATP-dependent sacrificial sulfur transferase LarE [Pyrinomonadaceae bacterium]
MRLIADQPNNSTESPSSNTALAKEFALRTEMLGLKRVLVAYSGGVDSTYLAAIAKDVLGDGAKCVLGISASVSEFQIKTARENARKLGLNYSEVETSEISLPGYRANSKDRCYHCKSNLYSLLLGLALEFKATAILDGTNFDDLKDFRPGRKAAEELNVRSPLAELKFTKSEIRLRSRLMNLATWDAPASPCLASRIPHGIPVSIERLKMIEKAENIIRDNGFKEFRVRAHGDLARIEIAKNEMQLFLRTELLNKIDEEFKKIGFKYVTFDLGGFRSGSLSRE